MIKQTNKETDKQRLQLCIYMNVNKMFFQLMLKWIILKQLKYRSKCNKETNRIELNDGTNV